ncbi:alpha-galactosidase [Rhodoluna limnophila]|uniref:alpha-galactosidase n=1 Tax=Rhodoluna limnophila TaxID=232537 RepID=UPI001105BAB2|nr:alpha-galactosidase [Rhodoluna limnophila]
MTAQTFYTLSADGVSVIIDLSTGTPVVLHWGSDLGSAIDAKSLLSAMQEGVPHADLDAFQNPGIWRENSRGYLGRPAVQGHRDGQDWSQMFDITEVSAGDNTLFVRSADLAAGLEVTANFELGASGILKISQTIKNLGATSFSLGELTTWLPIPDYVSETVDFTGRWVKERQPQRREIQVGTWAREIREGRSGHDYTIVQLAMTKDADYQRGEVFSLGLQWSGNTRHLVERQPTGRTTMGAGELLLPGEVILASGETYEAPTVVASYSGEGVDGITDRHYRWLRSRPTHPSNVRPRPLTLNVWEAVYFNHNLEKLEQLADVAQEIGVERFVLDDGWFGSRRDDHSGLGDWVVSKDVWPNGLKPLIDVVKSRGMEFGLWFEGEMVNPDSDLYRAHPEWILHVGDRVPPEGRFQQVLDLTHQGAYDHVFGQVDAILSEYDIAYIKWDHNRTLTEAAHLGQAAVREQTKAIYRLFDQLKANHPGLEIESCSSGGGRIDLGMVEHADRFWTSDCNDALERQYIQRYTQFAIPPEMLGSHIGPTHSHTTHRTHSLSFRAISALFGHAGLEWDVTETTPEERAALKSWASYYKANRSLLHTGKMIRVEQPDDSSFVHGVVSQDKSKAIFAYVTLRAIPGMTPTALRLEGLDPKANYRIKMVQPAGAPEYVQRRMPTWIEGVELSGAALSKIGVRPPILAPENGFLVEVERV